MEQFIEDSSLEGWKGIGSGGFGQIYKARHRQWACDVAIKLLRYDDGNNKSLLREIKMMQEASSPHVIRVLGVFKGRPPNSGWATQLGVVMELMERGSLASLQEALDGPPPWPLVFRLAHQVALGINFLHSLPRPVLHKDLKPQNVLLDDDLNAKLTDFGLSRISYSVARVSKKDDEDSGGTFNYMPPEAFGLTYKPKRASDIYSYGILLWSIATGKQPYENAKPTRVKLLIPDGQRPLMDDIKGDAAGLTELTELMKRCWDNTPEERPRALECTTKTEELYQKHKDAISDTVHEVLKKLDQKEKEDKGNLIAQASESDRFEDEDVVDYVRKVPRPIQEEKKATPKQLLLGTLEDLGAEDFEKFKWYLKQKEVLGDFPAIPTSRLENANRVKTVDQMFQTYSMNTIKVTRTVLVTMGQNSLAQNLS